MTYEYSPVKRIKCLMVLTEGDILKKGDDLMAVSHGEVSVYSDGKIDQTNGSLHPVSREALVSAISTGSQVFNYDEEIEG